MSLARVISYGSLTQERRPASIAVSSQRNPSFSPLPQAWGSTVAQVTVQSVAAFEVPKAQRICGFFSPARPTDKFPQTCSRST